mgnify:CR=1 FL=1
MTAFQKRVIESICFSFHGLSEKDEHDVLRHAAQLEERGWDVSDAIRYIKCREEVNSDLAEDVALSRMEKITAKYL